MRDAVGSVAALLVVAFVPLSAPVSGALPAQTRRRRPQLAGSSLAEQEAFLKKAKVVRTRGAGKGITGTLRATLSDGTLTHDASIQTIDESKQRVRGQRRAPSSTSATPGATTWPPTASIGCSSSDMIPPSIERSYNGKTGAFTWWVDDVLMDEGERLKKKVEAPDAEALERADVARPHLRSADLQRRSQSRQPGHRQGLDDLDDRSLARLPRCYDELKTPGNLAQDAIGACSSA